MRVCLVLCALLTLTSSSLSQGMFELPAGEWELKEEAYQVVRLTIGKAPNKTMVLEYGEKSRDLRMVKAEGTYKVLANKGDPMGDWNVEKVTHRGRHPAPILGLGALKKGDKFGFRISYEGDHLELILFDDQAKMVLQKKMVRKKSGTDSL